MRDLLRKAERIVIGLGAGRAGTASLAALLSAQDHAVCFHEMNPSCVAFRGTPRPILNGIGEFQHILDGGAPAMLTVDLSREASASTYSRLCGMKTIDLIGDVAFYYLSYVERIAAFNQGVRFVCLKRDRTANIQSWIRKATIHRWPSKILADRLSSFIMGTPYYRSRNHWMDHDGSRWEKDPVWDKCFPKFAASDLETAVGMYWDYYYAEADRLQRELSGRFITFQTDKLGDAVGQRRLLEFCGVREEEQRLVQVHLHRSD